MPGPGPCPEHVTADPGSHPWTEALGSVPTLRALPLDLGSWIRSDFGQLPPLARATQLTDSHMNSLPRNPALTPTTWSLPDLGLSQLPGGGDRGIWAEGLFLFQVSLANGQEPGMLLLQWCHVP